MSGMAGTEIAETESSSTGPSSAGPIGVETNILPCLTWVTAARGLFFIIHRTRRAKERLQGSPISLEYFPPTSFSQRTNLEDNPKGSFRGSRRAPIQEFPADGPPKDLFLAKDLPQNAVRTTDNLKTQIAMLWGMVSAAEGGEGGGRNMG